MIHHQDPETITTAAQQMWNWCIRFVVPHHLCPWAAASVTTPQAISLYMVVVNAVETEQESTSTILTATAIPTTTLSTILNWVAQDFWNATHPSNHHHQHENSTNESDKFNSAIAFIVFVNEKNNDIATYDDDGDSFMKFYHQFMQLEEQEASDWEWEDTFTLAPFHPQWRFQENEDVLNFEKKTPFPTISMVYTSVIDRAGEMATQQILERNEATLRQKSFQEWNNLYNAAIRHNI
jgi:hypothetical protein